MKKITFVLCIVVLFFSFCSKNGKQAQKVEKKTLLVTVVEAREGSLVKFLNYKGTVQAWKTANITPDVTGRIGKIYRKQGDVVKQGDLLAELDLTTMELQQKQAKAAVAVTESAYRDAQLTFERMKKMFENKAISQMQYEKAQLGLDAADTQLKSARANLDLVDYTMKKSSMRAPFDGVVAAKNLEEGDMINPMMGMGASVLTVMDLSRVKVLIDIAGEDIETVAVDQKCQVHVSSLQNQVFSGKVYSKNLAADPMSKTFKVEVVVDNPGMRIKAGVYADIAIEVFRSEKSVILPISALVGNDQVMVYENGVAKKRKVKIGTRSNEQIEIMAGVTLGEKVLVEGNYDLKDGSPVAISGDKK